MAQYPTAAGTDTNLFVVANNKSTLLSDNPLTIGATTVNVTSTTGFPTAGYITIDSEAIKYTGVTGTSFTSCTRGADGTPAASHTVSTNVFHTVVADHHNVLKDEIKAIETDLVALQAAVTPVTATSTATSALNRVAMIANQIKTGFGLTNWYDAIATAALLKGGGTMSGAIAMGASKITGLAAATANGDAIRYEQVNGFRVLQIIKATTTTAFSTTSSTFASTSLTASITPSSASSTILVIASGCLKTASTATLAFAAIFRGTTNLHDATSGGAELFNNAAATLAVPATLLAWDSPATTSATTYTVKLASSNNSASVSWGDNPTQTILLIEIG